MSFIAAAVIGGVAALGAGYMASSAAGDAADQMAAGGRDSNALQKSMYDQTRQDNAGIRARGEAAGNTLSGLMGPGGSLTRNFSAADMASDPQYAQLQPQINSALQRSSSFQTSPGYQFRMDEGLKATGNSANARNGSYSGATLKALARFGQDTASQEYGNWFNQSNTDRNFVAGQGQDAFNRFTGNQDRQYNRLAGIAGSGQTATNNVNAAGAAYAQNAGNALQGMGNAQAAGTIGSANAWGNSLSTIANQYQQRQQPTSSYYASPVIDGGYSMGIGSAYGGTRQGM